MSKSNSKLISVIIPIYNTEPYLRHCIESVLKQTYSTFEIILVNDGSTDHCGEICDEYASDYDKIKVIHKENGGVSDARNTGLEVAKGQYITFIDSDDRVDKTYLDYLYKMLLEEHADIAVCGFIRTSNEKTKRNLEKIDKFTCTNLEGLGHLFGPYYIQLTIACCKLYKKSLFQNIRFPVGKLHEDEFTTYKLIHGAERIAVSTKKLYFYMQHKASTMNRVKFSLQSRLDTLEFLKERIQFFDDIDEPILRDKTIKNCFFIYENINDNLKNHQSISERELFKADFYQFKDKLEESEQNLKFKVYYKSYYLNPVLASFSFGLVRTLKSKLFGIFKL